MTAQHPDPAGPDPTLDAVLASYMKAAEAGPPPDRQAFLARHSEHADELAEFFACLDLFEPLAAVRRASRSATAHPAGTEPAPPTAGWAPDKP
jgi:hypothetical protein